MSKNKTINKIFQNSIIEQEYIDYLKNEDIKIISFDIFDTLFFRKCGLPENIFLEMGENDLVKKLFFDSQNFKNYRINCEKEAYNKSKNEEIFLKDIYDNFSISKKEKNNLLKLELKIENENLFLNEHIYKWIKLAKNYNKKVILISDMYLSLKDIKRIALNKLEKISFIDNIYISSEIGFRKATGKLFEYVLNDNYIKNNEILHIGDNIRSDINIANAIGIKTIFYNYDKNFHNILDNERIYLKDKFISKDYLRLLSYLSNPYKNEEEKFFYEIGSCFFGPILWEFSIWLKEIVDKQEIKQLNFFMREGFTFEKVFNRLFPDIKTSKVEISRESTNFLNLNLDDLSEVNFNKFKEFKVKDFYAAYFLEINDEKIKSIENELLKNLESIHYITDDILSRKDEIIKNINYQKKALKKYLKNLKINENSTFIDFGGGATVINRINNCFFENASSKLDILFFMHSEGVKNSIPNRIFSFFPSNEKTISSIEKIRRTPDFFEILLNGYNYSTSRYELLNNKVNIVKKEASFFDKTLKYNLEIFYDGIESFIKITKDNNDLISLYDREYLCLLMARLIALPTPKEVKYLGNLKYDEGKGSNYFYTIVKDNQKSVDLQELYLQYLNAPFRTQYEYPWMEGFITSIEPSLIKKFYGNVQTQNESALENILNQIDELSLKEVSIYGAGEIFEMLFPYLKDRDINIKNVIDSRAKINTFKFLDFNVKSLENTNLTEHDIIVIASVVYYDEIKESIVNHNKKLRYI
ncbi:HAD-IA family hydrolase [Aliarcobacter cryaerophilus]|uniref:HAD-IA family hydrolase n=1 Tax=Aliarcobacter cryaerophilus TaxID=28198 RepID=UPI0021B5E9D3|nr:HAD-IA family hydrolase [Aliarcobacter cryaerophilus]MCT7528318.1 HAD-IA family hydrolase [Aliarcobacter cryaerophilus]